MRKYITLTCGLPRSGKSTWTRQQCIPTVNPDSVRLAYHGKRFDPSLESEVWDIVFIMAEALLNVHTHIIIDATNYKYPLRASWLKKYPDAIFQYVVFTTSVSECQARAIATDQADLVPVIAQMAEKWDLPIPLAKEGNGGRFELYPAEDNCK